MKPILRWAALAAVLAAALASSGCVHLWTQVTAPQVIFGPPVIQGEAGKITVSVANFPTGAGALGVEFGGFSYPADRMTDLRVEGKNGFVVLAQRFAGGEGGFILSSVSSLDTGPVAVISFRVSGPIPADDIGLDKNLISVVDRNNARVGFQLAQPAYYAR